MATYSANTLVLGNLSTYGQIPATASYRDFVQKMTTGFEAIGWVNTNAVGSIDTGSFIILSASGSIVGYQVWRFNDTLHNNGSAPVFVKIEYANVGASGILLASGFYATVGNTHNGSGTVGTNAFGLSATPRIAVGFEQGTSGSTVPIYMCAISGGSAVGLTPVSSVNAGMFLVERTTDANGNYTAEGINVSVYDSNNDRARSAFFSYARPDFFSRIETAIHGLYSTVANTTYGANLSVNMAIPVLPYGFGYPSRLLGFFATGDITVGSTIQFIAFSTQSNFFVPNVGAQPSMFNRNATANGNVRLLIRYE